MFVDETAPQSMSLALAAPAYPSGIRNKIAYSPLPVPISTNYQYARPIPPIPLGKLFLNLNYSLLLLAKKYFSGL